MSIAHNQLQRRGMTLRYSDVTSERHGFTVHNLTLTGFADISLSSVSIQPELLTSALTFSPVCTIAFRGASVRIGRVMKFGDGSFLLTGGREVLVEDLHTNGEFSIDGYLTVDTSSMKIGRADAEIKFPEEFASNISVMKNFLPLVQEGGKWYLRRK